MTQFLTNEQIESSIAAGNYLVVNAIEFSLNKYPAYYLKQSPAAQRKIFQINYMLRLILPAWKAPEVVISYDNKAIILLLKSDNNLLDVTEVFPREKLTNLVTAVEKLAEKMVNPSGHSDEGAYRAHDQGGPSLESLLADINFSEEKLRLALPILSISQDDSIEILIARHTGDAKAIHLPPTEQLRQPASSVNTSTFSGQIVGHIPGYNFVMLDGGKIVDPSPRDSSEFVVGQWYEFSSAGDPIRFSKSVYLVNSDMVGSYERPPYYRYADNHELYEK